MTSIALEPEDLELEGANETDLDAVSQQVDQIQKNIRQVMAPRPEEGDEDWDDLESGEFRNGQADEASPLESEEEFPADGPADVREEGSDAEPDIGRDQNKDA